MIAAQSKFMKQILATPLSGQKSKKGIKSDGEEKCNKQVCSIINLRAKRGGSLFDLAFVGDKGVTASSAVFSGKVVQNVVGFLSLIHI